MSITPESAPSSACEPEGVADEAPYIPGLDYWSKGIELAAAYDKQLATLYLLSLGGLLALLLRETYLAATFVLLAMAVLSLLVGLAFTLIHMDQHTKRLMLMGLMQDGREDLVLKATGADTLAKAIHTAMAVSQRAWVVALISLPMAVAWTVAGLLIHFTGTYSSCAIALAAVFAIGSAVGNIRFGGQLSSSRRKR